MRYILIIFCLLLLGCGLKKKHNNIDLEKIQELVVDTMSVELFEIQEFVKNKTVVDPPVLENKVLEEANGFLPEDRVASVRNEKTIPKGRMVYGVPDTMQVGKLYLVNLAITKDLSIKNEEILSQLNIPKNKSKSDYIRISSIMSAELLDIGDNFTIKPLSTTEQNIEDFGFTEWGWSITPLKSGNNPLRLLVKVKVLTENGSNFKDVPVFNKDIYVKANITYGVLGFFGDNWQWFMSTLLIPISLYLWNKKKKRTDQNG